MPCDIVDKLSLDAKKWSVDHDNAFRIPDTGKPLPTKMDAPADKKDK